MASQGTLLKLRGFMRIVGMTALLGTVAVGCKTQPPVTTQPPAGQEFVILQAVPVSISISEPSVIGGSGGEFTVDLTLGGPAPANGQLVNLYYSPLALQKALIDPPVAKIIEPGDEMDTFKIQTRQVKTEVEAIIFATSLGTTSADMATVRILPP